MTIGRIFNSDCVLQKWKDPLTRGADAETIAYMPVKLNSTQLNSALGASDFLTTIFSETFEDVSFTKALEKWLNLTNEQESF